MSDMDEATSPGGYGLLLLKLAFSGRPPVVVQIRLHLRLGLGLQYAPLASTNRFVPSCIALAALEEFTGAPGPEDMEDAEEVGKEIKITVSSAETSSLGRGKDIRGLPGPLQGSRRLAGPRNFHQRLEPSCSRTACAPLFACRKESSRRGGVGRNAAEKPG